MKTNDRYDRVFSQVRTALETRTPLLTSGEVIALLDRKPAISPAPSRRFGWIGLTSALLLAMASYYLVQRDATQQIETVLNTTEQSAQVTEHVSPLASSEQVAMQSPVAMDLSRNVIARTPIVTASEAALTTSSSIAITAIEPRSLALPALATPITPERVHTRQQIAVSKEMLEQIGFVVRGDTLSFIARQPLPELGVGKRIIALFAGIMPWEDYIDREFTITPTSVRVDAPQSGREYTGAPAPIFTAGYLDGVHGLSMWGSSNKIADAFLDPTERSQRTTLTDEEIARELDRLVPLTIQLPTTGKQFKVVMWFERTGLSFDRTSSNDVTLPTIATADLTQNNASLGSAATSTIVSALLVPNPTRERGSLEFTMTVPQAVTVSVYDALGQTVRIISGISTTVGRNSIELPTNGLGEGIYIVEIVAGKERRTLRWIVR